MRGLFVTGTDTGVGKTLVSAALLHALADGGTRTVGVKPVASGCESTVNGLRNEDALALQAAATERLAYDQINPVALAPAVAPHLAAEDAGIVIEPSVLAAHVRSLESAADWLVVEGAGGWRVPLGPTAGFADLAVALGYPVVLVVAVRLGCINHALLTADAILADGLPLAGWVANMLNPSEPLADRQVESLIARLPAPLLGCVPHLPTADYRSAASELDTRRLLS
ncbi:MAG: dethiobiotin synthase [Aquisalimonadaceae bacterium]